MMTDKAIMQYFFQSTKMSTQTNTLEAALYDSSSYEIFLLTINCFANVLRIIVTGLGIYDMICAFCVISHCGSTLQWLNLICDLKCVER